MSTIPYFLRNPALDDQAQPPMTMAPAAAPQGMAAQVVQHPMHAMIAPITAAPPEVPPMMSQTDIEGVGGNSSTPSFPATKQPKVTTMSPTDRYEENINRRLMADYSKDQNPWGSADNHPGFLGKLGHMGSQLIANAHHASGELTPRETEEQRLGGEVQKLEGEKSQQALQGAQTAGAQQRGDLEEQQARAAELIPASQEEADAYGVPVGTPLNASIRGALARNTQTVQGRQSVADANNREKLLVKPITSVDGTMYQMDPNHPGMAVPIAGPDGTPIKGVQKPVDIGKKLQNEIAAAYGMGDTETVRKLQSELQATTPNQTETAQSAGTRATAAMIGAGAQSTRAINDTNRFNADYYGTGPNGDFIPGTPMVNGQPVGFKGKLGATAENREGMAETVNAAKEPLYAAIDAAARVGVIGPTGGRITDFRQLVGNPDPKAQYLWGQIQSFTSLMPALHNMRAVQLAEHLQKASGGLKTTPEGLKSFFEGLSNVTEPVKQGIGSQRYTPGAGSGRPGAPAGGNNSEPRAPKSSGVLAVGTIQHGDDGDYKFKGGDRYNQKNWEKVK